MFDLDPEQLAAANKWLEPHQNESMGTIGGRFTYCFSPTSLGVRVVVKCQCGAEIDLTNYNDW